MNQYYITTLIFLFFVHWLADFVCQTQYMAENKWKDFSALFYHVLTYSCVLGVCLSLYFQWYDDNLKLFVTLRYWEFYMLTFGFHLFTDFFTSKLTHKLYTEQKIYSFFVVIGFDQFIHLVTLLLTIQLLF